MKLKDWFYIILGKLAWAKITGKFKRFFPHEPTRNEQIQKIEKTAEKKAKTNPKKTNYQTDPRRRKRWTGDD